MFSGFLVSNGVLNRFNPLKPLKPFATTAPPTPLASRKVKAGASVEEAGKFRDDLARDYVHGKALR